MAKYKQDTATQLQELLNTFAEQEKHIDMLQAKENSRKEEVQSLENKLKATVTQKEELEEKITRISKELKKLGRQIHNSNRYLRDGCLTKAS